MNTSNKKNLSSFLITVMLILCTFNSCKKDYFDINENPNGLPDVNETLLLPSAEAAIAHALGNDLKIYGGIWAQYWTQSPASSQYKIIEQYSPSANEFDRLWQMLYSDALKDLQIIVDKTTSTNPNYAACAKILQAYTYQLLTDNFGDIPFSQAIKLESDIFAPHYDSQASIYDGIIGLLNAGIALIDENSSKRPAQDDLLLHGNMALWKKFANTLKLRIYMRLSEVDPTKAQLGVTSLASAPFLGAADEVRIDYRNEGTNYNPLYSSFVDLGFTQNLVASSTCVDYMAANNDPRLVVFYDTTTSATVHGTYEGIPQGLYDLPATTPVSIPGPSTGGNGRDIYQAVSATAPVKFMTGYESLFLQAEAAARGWLGGNAHSLYEAAIEANFLSYQPFSSGLNPASAAVYYAQAGVAFPDTGTTDQKIEAIITEKWVAMCGNQNDEAWIESRRTGYPSFFVESANSIIGPGFPQRLFYPNIELTRNGNFPGQHIITDRVWWDIN